MNIEKYIDFHVLFLTMSIYIAYEYFIRNKNRFVLEYS